MITCWEQMEELSGEEKERTTQGGVLICAFQLVKWIKSGWSSEQNRNARKPLLWPTGADSFVVFVLLRVSRKATLEAVLPELGEPGVPSVGVQTQLQVVVVKRFDHFRLELHGDSSVCFLLIPLYHFVTIGPPVAVETRQAMLSSAVGDSWKHSDKIWHSQILHMELSRTEPKTTEVKWGHQNCKCIQKNNKTLEHRSCGTDESVRKHN